MGLSFTIVGGLKNKGLLMYPVSTVFPLNSKSAFRLEPRSEIEVRDLLFISSEAIQQIALDHLLDSWDGTENPFREIIDMMGIKKGLPDEKKKKDVMSLVGRLSAIYLELYPLKSSDGVTTEYLLAKANDLYEIVEEAKKVVVFCRASRGLLVSPYFSFDTVQLGLKYRVNHYELMAPKRHGVDREPGFCEPVNILFLSRIQRLSKGAFYESALQFERGLDFDAVYLEGCIDAMTVDDGASSDSGSVDSEHEGEFEILETLFTWFASPKETAKFFTRAEWREFGDAFPEKFQPGIYSLVNYDHTWSMVVSEAKEVYLFDNNFGLVPIENREQFEKVVEAYFPDFDDAKILKKMADQAPIEMKSYDLLKLMPVSTSKL